MTDVAPWGAAGGWGGSSVFRHRSKTHAKKWKKAQKILKVSSVKGGTIVSRHLKKNRETTARKELMSDAWRKNRNTQFWSEERVYYYCYKALLIFDKWNVWHTAAFRTVLDVFREYYLCLFYTLWNKSENELTLSFLKVTLKEAPESGWSVLSEIPPNNIYNMTEAQIFLSNHKTK